MSVLGIVQIMGFFLTRKDSRVVSKKFWVSKTSNFGSSIAKITFQTWKIEKALYQSRTKYSFLTKRVGEVHP